MKVLRGDPHAWEPPEEGSVLTVGVFDGVHLGHRRIGASLLGEAEQRGGLAAGIVTFDRHPLATISPTETPDLITTLDEQVEQWTVLGMSFVAVLTFEEDVRSMTPARFAETVLSAGLGARHIVVGAGFRFGRDSAGDVAELRVLGDKLGFTVGAVELVEMSDMPVSSTQIRGAIADGEMESAARWLGRRFTRAGVVIPGANRGAEIGFATANLAIQAGLAVPGHGVYAAFAVLDGERLPAVVNIGTRPTFDDTGEVVEAHLLDFDQDIYGRSLILEFVKRLRGERRFESVEDLVDQIGRDVAEARALLGAC